MEVLTFGHGTESSESIVALLHTAGVEICSSTSAPPPAAGTTRTSPGRRWNAGSPNTASPTAGSAGSAVGANAPAGSPDVALRNKAFAGYAEYMRSAEFAAAVDALLVDAECRRTTVMCAESMWWRCHRMLLADFLVLVRGTKVRHLLPDGRLQPHRPSDLARRRDDGLLVYDAGQQTL